MPIVADEGSIEQIKARARFPLTLRWPAKARVVCLTGQWRRVEGGRIEATYTSKEQLELCLRLAADLR